MDIIFGIFLLIVGINAALVLRATHRRRLAGARLDIAKVVTAMDKMMLESKIKNGDSCHDHLYKNMLQAEYADRFSCSWNIFCMATVEEKRIRLKLHDEVSQNSEIGNLLQKFIRAQFSAFANDRPFVSFLFVLWVMFAAGGIKLLIVSIRTKFAIRNGWHGFKQAAAEAYAGWLMANRPQNVCHVGPFQTETISSKLHT